MIQVWDIRSARKRLGLSQERLAEELGVSRNTISRWERGEFLPNADKMAELERMLAQLEAPAVPEDTPVPVPDDEPVAALADPPSAKPRRWPQALVCAGVVCALLIGVAALIGIYSINQRLGPEVSTPPIEEAKIEGEEVDESTIIGTFTLHP